MAASLVEPGLGKHAAEDALRVDQGHLQEGVWPESDQGGDLCKHERGCECSSSFAMILITASIIIV